MRVAKVFGIPLFIDPLLIALLVPAFLLGQGTQIGIAFFIVLLHEFCHALAAKALGIQTHSVELMPFGGVAKMERIGGGKEFLIALAGPAFNLLLAGILNAIALLYPAHAMAIYPWFMANMAIGLFNLVPAFPLDGGRMLRALLALLTGREAAARISAMIGICLGMLLAVLGILPAYEGMPVNITLTAVGGFVALAAWREWQGLPYTAMKNTTGKRKRIRSHPLEQKNIAAAGDTKARDLIRDISGGKYHTVTVLDDDMDKIGALSEKDIVRALMDDGDVSLHGILRLKKRAG